MQTLSPKECLTFAWRTFKSRPWIFVQAGLLLFLINAAVNVVQTLLEMGSEDATGAIVMVVSLLSAIVGVGISFLISIGEASFFLRAHKEAQTVSLRDLWHPESFWNFVGASLISGILIFLGFILLIVPGIILAIIFMFVGYVVVDKGLNPIEALKESMRLTKGSRWKLFQLGLLTLGLNLIGFLALIVGLLVTIPVSYLAVTHAYRVLSKEETAETEVAEAVAA